jgi:hypothetical protein
MGPSTHDKTDVCDRIGNTFLQLGIVLKQGHEYIAARR